MQGGPNGSARRRGALTAGVLISICTFAARVQAGNLDSFYVSGEAALSGGAVVASTSTGGSIWYNPAGLSQLGGLRFDVNVSGYAVRFGARVGFASTVPETSENRLGLLALDVVPAAVTITRRFGRVGVGLGVFVPSHNALMLRTHLQSPQDAAGTRALEFGYDSHNKSQEYHLGPGFGWDPWEQLSLGMSALANYHTELAVTDVTASVARDGNSSLVATHSSIDSVGVGLELVLGAQWRFLEHWTLGTVVRTPSLRLAQAGDRIRTELAVDTAGARRQDISFEETLSIGTQILSPFRFHVGISHKFSNLAASVEGSILLPYQNRVFDIREPATYNARAGLRAQLNEFWSLGGGIFTDRSNKGRPQDFLDKKIDYYGATIAVDWVNSYGVYARNRRVLEEPRSLVFGTTVAFSYALGLGWIAGALVGPGADGNVQLQPNLSDVVAHEFTLHIATTLSE